MNNSLNSLLAASNNFTSNAHKTFNLAMGLLWSVIITIVAFLAAKIGIKHMSEDDKRVKGARKQIVNMAIGIVIIVVVGAAATMLIGKLTGIWFSGDVKDNIIDITK